MSSSPKMSSPPLASSGGGGGSSFHPRLVDVLCGRGGGSQRHPGNEVFRVLVRDNQPRYATCERNEKGVISRSIVSAIRERGRFVEQGVDGLWSDIGEKKSVEKVSQALREGLPDIRTRMAKMKEAGGVLAERARALEARGAASVAAVREGRDPGKKTGGGGGGGDSAGGSGPGEAAARAGGVASSASPDVTASSASRDIAASFASPEVAVSSAPLDVTASSASPDVVASSVKVVAAPETPPPDGDGPPQIHRTPSGTPYILVGPNREGSNPLLLSENSLRRLKLEHGMTLSEESLRALIASGELAVANADTDELEPIPVDGDQYSEMRRAEHQRRDTQQISNLGQIVVGRPDPGNGQRQSTMTASNCPRDLRANLVRVPSTRTLCPEAGPAAAATPDENRSNMSLASDFSAIGMDAAASDRTMADAAAAAAPAELERSPRESYAMNRSRGKRRVGFGAAAEGRGSIGMGSIAMSKASSISGVSAFSWKSNDLDAIGHDSAPASLEGLTVEPASGQSRRSVDTFSIAASSDGIESKLSLMSLESDSDPRSFRSGFTAISRGSRSLGVEGGMSARSGGAKTSAEPGGAQILDTIYGSVEDFG